MTTEPEDLTAAAVYSALKAFTPLTDLVDGTDVYQDLAPASASWDVCTFGLQGAVDFDDRPGLRRYEMTYQIKGISAHSPGRAGSISNQIYNRMHAMGNNAPGTAISVAGFTNLWQGRVQPLRLRETAPEGDTYYHAGGLYRIILEESA